MEVRTLDAEINALEKRRQAITKRLLRIEKRGGAPRTPDECANLRVELGTITGTGADGCRHVVAAAELPRLRALRDTLLVPSRVELKRARAEFATREAEIKAQYVAESAAISRGERPKRTKAERDGGVGRHWRPVKRRHRERVHLAARRGTPHLQDVPLLRRRRASLRRGRGGAADGTR